jgi:hypothetical protein
MSKRTFNFKKAVLNKKAYNDGAKPGMMKSRQFANCQKAKVEGGMSAQEAWQSCLEEYQVSKSKATWAKNYS